jgi:carbamoyl-phosphate synthase large subunit
MGTAGYLRSHGLNVETLVAKVGEEGMAADAVELIADGKVQLVINTPRGRGPRADGTHIRAASVAHRVPCLTTLAAARAAAAGLADLEAHPLSVRCLQELHAPWVS